MYHITVSPDTFEITKKIKGQNPFIDIHQVIDKPLAKKQHANLRKQLVQEVNFQIKTTESIPDLVFMANSGFSLPRLPEAVIILPNMKYATRRAELPYIKEIMKKLRIQTYEFPHENIFEGGAEVRWFHNEKTLVHGYGQRSTKESVDALKKLVTKIYNSYNVTPPQFVSIHLPSPEAYHIDLALIAYSETGCIVRKGAIDTPSIQRLRKVVEDITILDTTDPFATNVIVLKDTIITHKLRSEEIKKKLEEITKKKIVQVDLSEFEKSGGAAACLVIQVYDPHVKAI